MRIHEIEIDDAVWNHLKKFAEPFVDTPNSVLRRLLFNEIEGTKASEEPCTVIDVKGLPIALSQIFEVLYEIEINGYSRTEATNRVAAKRGTAPQTIIDKYCRQLNKRALEIDRLFNEPDYTEFKELLKNKFKPHCHVIDIYFDTLLGDDGDAENREPELEMASLNTPLE